MVETAIVNLRKVINLLIACEFQTWSIQKKKITPNSFKHVLYYKKLQGYIYKRINLSIDLSYWVSCIADFLLPNAT